MRKDKAQRVLSIAVISFLIVFLAIPVCGLLFRAFQNFDGNFVGIENFKAYLGTRGFKITLGNSMKVTLTAVGISMITAFVYAYGVNKSNIKCKGVFHWIALLPLFAPTMTHSIALIYLFGTKGIITNLLGLSFDIYGFWGIVLSEALYVFPVVYLLFSMGLKNGDNRLYEAAEIMGISSMRQFFTITIPNMKFSIITAFFSSFTMAFTDFGAPKIIGGRFSVLATEIYKKMLGQQDFEMGAVIGVILIIPAVIAFIVDYYISKNNKMEADSKGTKYVIQPNKSRDIIFTVFNVIIVVFILMIFATTILSSFVESWPYNMNLTTKWFNFNVLGMSGIEMFGNSIFVSILTAITGTILAFVAAYFSERGKIFKSGSKLIYLLGILPNAIPGLTIGIAYMLFFNKAANPLKFLYGTFAILILANVIHFFSTPFLTISNELKTIDKEYENASEVMGVKWSYLLKNVIIPLSLPAILESFSYYFVNSMMTVSAIVFLYMPHTRVATISMINKVDTGEMAAAAAVAVMIIFTNVIFRLVFDRIVLRIKKKRLKCSKV
ncbi:iron(III) transport system permease protein [Clostridium collagenovorans DSM 3089]|uniref:Iron(III) transport system permease protein n=1 Tax=Clostridium collagenovorans DSM 3089 TaxID=1121306 RepID=A0A1M5YJ13_9CLOT|nr:putative 2-aminoethylphosphonate ABC transporter permease subunit [Clostridium collagenovorans]SHI12027.1 iron(III) transport system permease protein [Clostridium collagenovorans DSM 3089]